MTIDPPDHDPADHDLPDYDPADRDQPDCDQPGHGQAVRDKVAPVPTSPKASTAPGTQDAYNLITPRHHAAADALRRALDEGHVYAALTGPRGTGKSTVLAAVLATVRGLRVLRVAAPDKVTEALGAEIERVALGEATKPETDRHVAIIVDDAHLASSDLLDSLARLAAARRVGGRLPQVLLVGQPVLWDRLRADRFRALERRLAIRHELLPATAEGPWASIEQALTPVMAAATLTPSVPTLEPPATPTSAALPPDEPAVPARPMASAVTYRDPSRTASSQTGDPLARSADFVPEPRPQSRATLVAVALTVLVIAGITVSAVLTTFPKPSQPPVAPLAAPPTAPPAAPTSKPASALAPTPALVPAMPVAPPLPAPDAAIPAASPSALPPEAPPAPRQAAELPAPEPRTPEPPPAAQRPPTPAMAPAPEPVSTDTPPPEPARAAPATEVIAPPTLTPAAEQPPEPAAAPRTEAVTQPAPTVPASQVVVPQVVAPQAVAPQVMAPTPAPPPISPGVTALMLRRGEERLALGDFAAARSFLERAATGGSARAALLTAQTYDPSVLRPAAASFADTARAAEWYRRAAALGDKDAIAHLRQTGDSSR